MLFFISEIKILQLQKTPTIYDTDVISMRQQNKLLTALNPD